jgi:hypothetical protein
MSKAAMLILALMLLTACAEPGIQAEKEAERGVKYEYDAGFVRYVSDDLLVEAQYLSPGRADLYYSYFRDGKYDNPFTKSFAVFSVSFTNKGKGRLSFDPKMAMLLSGKGAPMSALDFTSLYAELSLVGADDMEGRMRAYKETCFDSQVTIMPGERMQRLIVFTRDSEMGKGGSLVLEGVYMDHKPRTVRLTFKELL